MNPVMQTITDRKQGDCLRACVASVLELPIEEVPDFCAGPEPRGWFGRLSNWCLDRGYGVTYSRTKALTSAIEGHCILGISTSDADWAHAVVGTASRTEKGMAFTVLHDPHPNSSVNGEFLDVLWIVRNAT